MQRILIILLSFSLLSMAVHAQSGEISGRVVDDTGESLPSAAVIVEQDGSVIRSTTTDFDGNYIIRPLDPGRYDVRVRFLGYDTELITGVQVNVDRMTTIDVTMGSADQEIGEVVVREFRVPLIDRDDPGDRNPITREEITRMPTRDIASIASTSAAVYQQDEGDGLNIRGSREDGTEYYIDGVRVRGSSNIPVQSIEQMTVITGGVPARFGDAVGGIVNITTRGPSRTLHGGVEVLTSQFLDAFGYNMASFNLTGPLIKRDDYRRAPLLGFFIAGEYERQKDPRPSAIGTWKVKDDVMDELENSPLLSTPDGDGVRLRAETITMDDLESIKARQDAERENFSFTGRLDFSLTDNLNLAFGGTYDLRNDRDYVDRYALFNSINNPTRNRHTWRVFGRFTQRFLDAEDIDADDADGPRRTVVRNAFYTLQADFSKVKWSTEGPGMGFNPFDYGYYGKFERHRAPIYESGTDSLTGQSGLLLVGYRDTLVTFTPGDINPTATNYAIQYFEIAPDEPAGWYENLDQIQQRRGLINGVRAEIPYGIWYNTGRVINGYGYNNDDEQYRLSLNAAFDVIRPGATRNRHSIEFGFEFEQRVDRQYFINPLELWTLMRQLTNTHISQLDLANPEIIEVPFGQDTINYPLRYDESEQTHFDRNLRESLGLAVDGTDFINVYGMDPSDFSLDMFSADELLQEPYVSYFGYDHTGNRLDYRPTFEDFFTAKNDEGEFTRPIDAFRPIYSAFYVQDRFQFRDIMFNVGVRVDRFDANQKVLRDPYSLYAIRSASEVDGELNPSGTHPSSIGGDFAVYVDDFNAENPTILGYRDGDNWYTAEGSETSDAASIERGSVTGRITPYLVDPSEDVRNEDFDVNASFKDYDPQITVMPRISFSFNITDEASFYAHYDILTQRPQSFIRTSPTQWYYFERSGVKSNPNLRPERTIDYTLGFRQIVSPTSVVTFSAFYRELRDMVQVVRVAYAYPSEYTTFGNVDFGTVKGLTIGYDLRRTNNVTLKANYTLQFAEGTGSDNTSQFSLVNAGQPNLRTIIPLDYDSRHMFNINFDYRYGSGRDYNGPRIREVDIFENAGINIIARGRSGEPYTRQRNATPEALFTVPTRPITQGSINGARLPWNFRLDARVYKSFDLGTVGQIVQEDGTIERRGKRLNLDVYLMVQNVLNTANVIRVYPYTGNPDDDGYLTSAEGVEYTSSRANPESFTDLYRAWIDNPRNYSLPRTIRLGAVFTF